MVSKEITIKLINGFHIRPATKFVKETRKFVAKIKIKFKDKIIDAKNLFEIQTLGISYNDIITIIVDGEDEFNVLNILINLLKSFKE